MDRVVATGSLVQRKVGGGRNGEVAMLDSLAYSEGCGWGYLGPQRAIDKPCSARAAHCVLETQAEVNFSGRDKRTRAWGQAGTAKRRAFSSTPPLPWMPMTRRLPGLRGGANLDA